MNKKIDEEYKGIKDIYVLQCICSELKSQLHQKENIIKEMREFIESYNLPKDLGHLGEAPISIRELRDILDILDKENI